jgi:DNA-binding CsgD family transcriptional regulator/transcriptional regulator with GAF, ATPase, and Fis domain
VPSTSAIDPPFDVAVARRVLTQLRALQRDTVERAELERVEALERVRGAIARLGELGTHEGVLDRAAAELGAAGRFDRVIVSAARDGMLAPHSLWQASGAEPTLDALRQTHVRLEYPLIEAEVALGTGASVVDVRASGQRSPRALGRLLGWTSYVVVALTLGGRTVGLLHADATLSARAMTTADAQVASLYAAGLTGALERAALRDTLRRHREELRSAVQWLSTQLEDHGAEPRDAADGDDGPLASLTRRELEVLQLLARGRTNGAIARTLLISEATAKYHVTNILRKLQASSRADAVARYLRSAG